MLAHPLCGADIQTLIDLARRHRTVAARHLPAAGLATLSALGRLPFSLAEHVYVERRRRRLDRSLPLVFILGHWRSGTTHLYNVLSQSEQFGYVSPIATGMPWDTLLFARMIRPLLVRMLPDERFIDRLPVTATSPQEDEAALANMQAVSYYHGLYFPKRLREEVMRGVFFEGLTPKESQRWEQRFQYFVDKMRIEFPGRRIVLKNPVYTARVAQIRKLYPDAQFIHIHRHPIEVFRSMRHFYHKLLEQMALQPYATEQIDELVLEVYPKMMQALVEETAKLPAEQFVEIRYDDLDDQPMEQIEKIYEQLNWPGIDQDRQAFEAYLQSVASYKKNKLSLPEELQHQVASRWQAFFDRWGYAISEMS